MPNAPRPIHLKLGQLVITANAAARLRAEDIPQAIDRHARGDWGEVNEHDRLENERAVAQGLRLLSVYRDRAGTKFWIISEADRSATTVLLPEDY